MDSGDLTDYGVPADVAQSLINELYVLSGGST